MRQTCLAWSLAAAVSLGSFALAQETPAPTTEPAAAAQGDQDTPELLGSMFENESAGISLRLPAGMQRTPSSGTGGDIAQFGDPARKWQLKLSRVVYPAATMLTTGADNFGKPIPGVLDQTVAQMKRDLPGCTFLRQDLTNIADGDPKVKDNVAMVAVRYTAAATHLLTQQATVQSNDRLFYVISLTSPATDSDRADAPPDQNERLAVETFREMLDSVRLLDTAKIRREQDARLYRTRALFVNWTRARLHAVLINEQWLRIMKNGRDIGYSYVTEQPAAGVPRPLKPAELRQGKSDRDLVKPGDGVLIGIRSRMLLPSTAAGAKNHRKGPVQTDSATWLFVTPDRRLEDWSRINVVEDGTLNKDGKRVERESDEFGSSSRQIIRALDKQGLPGTKIDPSQPPISIHEQYSLSVTNITGTGASVPIKQDLPPWYLPQALGHLLPRLLPLEPRADGAPRTYMFATYVPEMRQVMTRYVEVGNPAEIQFNGRTVRAVPITDRFGWHGSITTHYMTPDGQYLGSENKDSHTLILPTDGKTLLSIWKHANLTQPGGTERPRGAARSAPPLGPREAMNK